MPTVPLYLSLSFIALVFFLVAFALMSVRKAAQSVSLNQMLRLLGTVAGALMLWFGVTATLALTSVLAVFEAAPPRAVLLAMPAFVAAVVLSRIQAVNRFLSAVPGYWWIGFQAFRVPMELILWGLFLEGVLPKQMTFEGFNFDVLAGLSAPVVAYWEAHDKLSRIAAIGWNAVCLALLANIVTIAVLSAPSPIQFFFNEPQNRIIAGFPFIWLPAFVVPMALFGHLQSLRHAGSGFRS